MLNMVETLFRDITQKRIRRGVFQNLEQLIVASENTSTATIRTPSPSSGPPKPQTSGKGHHALGRSEINDICVADYTSDNTFT